MSSVYYITDQQEGEEDILTPVVNEILRVYQIDLNCLSIDNEQYLNKIETPPGINLVLELSPPKDGWTHKEIELTNDVLIKITNQNEVLEAFLGKNWVGSSEC